MTLDYRKTFEIEIINEFQSAILQTYKQIC